MFLFYFRLLALLSCLLAAHLGVAQTITTDAVTAYWHLTDALRRNESLTDAAWQQFLAIPDNQAYVESVFDDDDLQRYRRALEVVYMPRYDSLRQAKVQAGSWYYVLLNDYKEHEADYKAFLAETARNPTYLEKMYTYAYEYLPTRDRHQVANLRLAYVAIGNDAISEARGIVFSLRSTRDWNSVKPGVLEAHEMHHRLRTAKSWGTLAPADEPLLWALTTAQNEGLADLIDKQVMLEQSADSADIRTWLLVPAPAVVHQLDSTIQVQAAGGAATPLKFYRRLTNGTNGHIPGFFMAYTILRNGYRQQLLDHANDPIAFALLYQKAAQQDKLRQHPPTLSPTSVRYLKQLARKYKRSRPVSETAQGKP